MFGGILPLNLVLFPFLFTNELAKKQMPALKLKRMKKLYFTILTICLTSAVFAQQKAICTANFDNFTLASESYWDGSDQTGGFTGPCGIWNFNNF